MSKINIDFVNPYGIRLCSGSVPVVRASYRFGNLFNPCLCLDNIKEEFFILPFYLWTTMQQSDSNIFVRPLPSRFASFLDEIGLGFDPFVTDQEWQEILKFAANVDANKQRKE